MRKVIVAVQADHDKVAALRKEGRSWLEIFGRFSGGTQVHLTQSQAEALHANGFAQWAGRRRMLIKARFEAFPKLRDLSSVAGGHVVNHRKEDWVGPFIRESIGRARCQRSL